MGNMVEDVNNDCGGDDGIRFQGTLVGLVIYLRKMRLNSAV